MASTEGSLLSEITAEQLDVEELKITSAVLVGAAHHYGAYCGRENDVFMECRMDSKDPRKCLKEGKEVTNCAIKFFKELKGTCNKEFTEHWTCLDFKNQDISHCRRTQKVFDSCMAAKQTTPKEQAS